jgi:uncharacterized membrane protein
MLLLPGMLLVVAGFAVGLDPLLVVLASALGLTSIAGQTQTIRPIITPLAANFNLAPAALLDLDDRFAVIRARRPRRSSSSPSTGPDECPRLSRSPLR